MHISAKRGVVIVKAHSHRARLRPSTSVTRRASTGVDPRLRPSTDVDALGMNAQAFSHVFHIGVDALGVNGP